MNERGSTTAEYVGIVIVIVLLFIGLLAVRSTTLGRRAPVRPLPAIIRLIEAPNAVEQYALWAAERWTFNQVQTSGYPVVIGYNISTA